ncbi:hypothetical protein PHA51_07750 [Rodentibacter pneumotropicus]|uniref:Uncharacterized protein n=1 Tax=Rodentibacter trehalosifermentans TaxID=1908263 RepID=A0A1V3J7A5_9PAST|nr:MULTISPECIES: hypothetical protein [Rodentibacter]MDC2825922.1 hypothetical protein [Rodentibacter pneumotropicus]OOF50809.1 hypothetical protein BKK52_01285 [Rodentibacter trehalosifermentans]
MNNSPSIETFNPFSEPKPKSNFLGRLLGKVVVSARHKISGVSQSIHQSIEDDVERRLHEQGEHFEAMYHSREIEHEQECLRLKRSRIKFAIMMLLIGVAIGMSMMGYWFFIR